VLTLTTARTHAQTYATKNTGYETLFTIAEITALFTLNTHVDKCLIESFEILNPDGSAVVNGDALYTRLNLGSRPDSALQFSTDISMTDGTVVDETFAFKIKATAFGDPSDKPTLTKDVSITVTICGSESLSLVSADPYTQTLDIGPSATAVTLSVPSLFSSDDPYCPDNSFSSQANSDFASPVALTS